MSTEFKLVRIPTLKTVGDFKKHLESIGANIPADETLLNGSESPLAKPIGSINGKSIGNRIAIQPMEGWDGKPTGGVTDDMLRRWERFGESGAKLIYGGEAMAVVPEGRANPNQIIINAENEGGIMQLRERLYSRHKELYGTTDDLVCGFQLTHSGRFCRPVDKKKWESVVAFRHPILDRKFNVTSDSQVITDEQVGELIQHYIHAARIAANAGADFVDIKHCHGYLLHEFLAAHTRPGQYGGSLENRTRILKEIIEGIRAACIKIDIGVRLSAFDFVPFKPDPSRAKPGKLGPGIPEEFPIPYPYAFGVNQANPLEYDLTETFEFVEICKRLGVKLLNLTAGSPYYNPHIQRPAAYPPSDGYQPAHDPLIDVARQIDVVRQIKQKADDGLIVIGSAYSYLQEYLPHVAQFTVGNGWTDLVGIGRMVLSYPNILFDVVKGTPLNNRLICRTFSDCTTAPRNGLISGCYPLDKYYAAKPEAAQLKEIKKAAGA